MLGRQEGPRDTPSSPRTPPPVLTSSRSPPWRDPNFIRRQHLNMGGGAGAGCFERLAWAKMNQSRPVLVQEGRPRTARTSPSPLAPCRLEFTLQTKPVLTRALPRAPRAGEPAPRARERPALFFSSKSPKQWQLQGMNNRKEPQTRWAEKEMGLPGALEGGSENLKINLFFFFSFATSRNPLSL